MTPSPRNRKRTRRGATLLVVLGVMFALGCGPSAERSAAPATIDVEVAPRYESGKRVAVESGCLGCHQIGASGANGPGPDLSAVGKQYRADQLDRILDNPPRPMPSYRELPADDKQALVDFLGQLRGS